MAGVAHSDDNRIVELRQKLAARDGKPGFKRNAQALKAEIARLTPKETST